MSEDWPFLEPKEKPVFVARSILRDGDPILVVTRDIEDGTWQFLANWPDKEEYISVVSLEEIVRRDPSVAQIAWLPFGGEVWRESPGEPWQHAHQKFR